MRELTSAETKTINGGVNLTGFAGGGIQLAGAYQVGFQIGQGINYVNRTYSGGSLGAAIYFFMH
jgi:hypothetical protein